MSLRSIQSLTEMSTRNLPGGKGRPAPKAENLTAICEPTLYKICEPPLWASTASYGVALLFYTSNSWKQGILDFSPRIIHVDLWWTKRRCGGYFSEWLDFPLVIFVPAPHHTQLWCETGTTCQLVIIPGALVGFPPLTPQSVGRKVKRPS
jgi:hypothetical protein